MFTSKPTLRQDSEFLGILQTDLIWPHIDGEGISGFRFSGEMAKIIHITGCMAEMESNSRWTSLIPVNSLLCLAPPAYPLRLPSIFWVRLALACSLETHSAELGPAGGRVAAICSLLPSAPPAYLFISSFVWVCIPGHTPTAVLLVRFHTTTAFSLFDMELMSSMPWLFLWRLSPSGFRMWSTLLLSQGDLRPSWDLDDSTSHKCCSDPSPLASNVASPCSGGQGTTCTPASLSRPLFYSKVSISAIMPLLTQVSQADTLFALGRLF